MGQPDHHFNPSLAARYGVDAAVFLHNIYHWIQHNEAYRQNCFEGRYWTYNSMDAFCAVHPYWSRRQIERIVALCKREGLILVGCFSKDRRDRTHWYTLSDEAMAFFADGPSAVAECIPPNGEMHVTEPCASSHQTVEALTDNKPNNKPDNKQQENESKGPVAQSRGRREYRPEWFDAFWAVYPRKVKKQEAKKAWDRLRPDRVTCLRMRDALERDKQSRQWNRDEGEFIPHPSTWLNQRRWEDEGVDPPPAPDRPGCWAPDPEVTG